MGFVASSRRSAAGLLALLALSVLPALLTGCGSGTMSSVEADPPTRGLLHYLQQAGQMGNVTDRGYVVSVEAEGGQPAAGSETSLTLQVLDPSGRPVGDFADDMTKRLHFIVVSKDLSAFQHLHPEYEGQGKFRVKLTFPQGGPFLLVSEFMPDGKGLTVHRQWMDVSGPEQAAQALVAVNVPQGGSREGSKESAKEGTPNDMLNGSPNGTSSELPKESPYVTVNGLEIRLTAMPQLNELKAGEMAMLAFTLRKAGTGERIALEPYLGTSGHCVVLDEKAEQYVHVHAAEEMSTASSVMFHAEFPKAGLYKLWAQFQYEGQVVTAPFVLRVA